MRQKIVRRSTTGTRPPEPNKFPLDDQQSVQLSACLSTPHVVALRVGVEHCRPLSRAARRELPEECVRSGESFILCGLDEQVQQHLVEGPWVHSRRHHMHRRTGHIERHVADRPSLGSRHHERFLPDRHVLDSDIEAENRSGSDSQHDDRLTDKVDRRWWRHGPVPTVHTPPVFRPQTGSADQKQAILVIEPTARGRPVVQAAEQHRRLGGSTHSGHPSGRPPYGGRDRRPGARPRGRLRCSHPRLVHHPRLTPARRHPPVAS